MFSKPTLVEGQGATEDSKQLGTFSVDVFNATYAGKRTPMHEVASFGDAAVGEKSAKKTGAFASTTTTIENGVTAPLETDVDWWTWNSQLETVKFHYGEVARLLLAGVPAHHFQKGRASKPEPTPSSARDIKPATSDTKRDTAALDEDEEVVVLPPKRVKHEVVAVE